jgi:ABC-type multidrug transport system ATPase subunit
MVYILGAEISLERELRVRDTLKIMGMYDSAYYFSMFITSLIVLIPSLIILCGILVATVFPSIDYSAFFWIFFQFAIACFPLPHISSLFVRSPSWAGFAAIGPLFLLAAIAILVSVVTTIPESDRIAASVVSLVGVQQAFDILCFFQANAYAEQATLRIDLTYRLPTGGAQAGSYSSMCLLAAPLYWMMYLYLEAVFPGEQGVPRRWHFIFTRPYRYCFSSRGSNTASPTRKALQLEFQDILANFEPAAEDAVCAVETRNLTKIFPALRRIDLPKVAVNNLSMKMYEGQILALLGHNSAGKSTTLSMLTGCLEPTSGTVLLRGPSGLQDTRSGRVPIGFCPQYDVLWPLLTVYETMCVYAQIKGLSLSEMDTAIAKMIESLEMTPKMHAPTGSLSGGQKRRLCVANALIGECKIVFLDEPTSGMDPFSRRALWKLIKEYQPGRCIVFTTHYMDEADILGDTVAVLSHGSLRVSGSPLFLKRRFGCGYTLSVLLPQIGTSDTQKSVDEVMTTVHKHVPSASIVMQEGQEVIINLSSESFTSFPPLLLSLDESRASSKIRDYGISLTSLDEVFMRIEDDGHTRPPPDAAVAEHNTVESVPVDLEAGDVGPEHAISSETAISELGESAPSRRRKTFDRAEKTYDFICSLDFVSPFNSSCRFGSDSMNVDKLKETYVPVRPPPGGASFWSQFYGLFVKRAITFKRDLSVAVISLILPIAIAVGAAAIMTQIPVLNCDKPSMIYSVPLSLDLSLLFGAKIPSTPYFLSPTDSKAMVATNFLVDPNPENVRRSFPAIPSSFAMSSSNLRESISTNRASIPGGLQTCCSDSTAASSGLNAYYNAVLLHSLPSTLTTAYSSLLARVNGGTISCQSWPLPKEDNEFFTPEAGRSVNGNLYGSMFLAVSVGIALGSLVVNPVCALMLATNSFLLAHPCTGC